MDMTGPWFLAIRKEGRVLYLCLRVYGDGLARWLQSRKLASPLSREEALELKAYWQPYLGQVVLLLRNTPPPPALCPECGCAVPPYGYRVRRHGYASRCLECERERRNAPRRQAHPQPRPRGPDGRFMRRT